MLEMWSHEASHPPVAELVERMRADRASTQAENRFDSISEDVDPSQGKPLALEGS